MSKKEKIVDVITFSSLDEATGTIPYNMLNDYMFRAVLQSNNQVLCGLIRALLHLSEEVPLKAEIINPILLGETIANKEFRLDINVIVNDSTYLNLEMQVANQLTWQNRSLSYLCRSYDQMNHGEDYGDINPTIHIGFLNFTLFEEQPQFYAKYKFMNTANHRIYSDNLELCVLDLTQIELATEEDKAYQIDSWAELFKSKTWEEMKMLAEKSKYIEEAAKTVYRMSAEEQVIKRCRDREDYYSDLRSYQKEIAKRDVQLVQKDAQLVQKDAQLKEKEAEIAELQKRMKEMEAKLNESSK